MSLGRCALVALGLAALSVAPPGRAAETLPPPPPPVPAPAGLEPTAPAPAAPATDAEVDADAAPPFDPFEYAILPVVSYDADSGAGAALLGLFYWNDPNIEPYRDHLLVFSYITTKLVQIHGLGWEHIGLFGKPKVRLRIGSTFTITSNDHYCGVGNEADCSKARARELLTADGLDPTSREFEHALDHFYKVRDLIPTVGFDLRWPVSSKVPDLLAFFGWRGTWLIPGQVGARGPFAHSLLAREHPDGEKGLLSAVEVGLLHQRRDEERQPTRGHVLSLSLRGSTRALGSDWDYAGFNLTFTGYVPLDRRGKLVFAARGVLDFMVGDGSVYTLSTVGGLFTQRGYGGKSLGRGIRQARYIGRIKGIGQAELRWTMFGRPGRFQLGSHTFIDLGWIGYDWGDFRGDRRRLLPGFGGGLTATWRKNFLVRLDAATSAFEDWAPSFYLNLTHPF
ncbi:MAG: BamA/TamA family outer membrane protein [Deltaproteobacteria bacterium]|nr:BamA/TamA family outer membrane protein [Deltaproteobacteria bacterium]MCB9787541.1 BamA/TamA family outer membrane protein [Deltaproteobacteria bacterium]